MRAQLRQQAERRWCHHIPGMHWQDLAGQGMGREAWRVTGEGGRLQDVRWRRHGHTKGSDAQEGQGWRPELESPGYTCCQNCGSPEGTQGRCRVRMESEGDSVGDIYGMKGRALVEDPGECQPGDRALRQAGSLKVSTGAGRWPGQSTLAGGRGACRHRSLKCLGSKRSSFEKELIEKEERREGRGQAEQGSRSGGSCERRHGKRSHLCEVTKLECLLCAEAGAKVRKLKSEKRGRGGRDRRR